MMERSLANIVNCLASLKCYVTSQYLPKKTNFLAINDKVVFEIEDKLNNRPRKVLGNRTPLEVMQGKLRPQKLHFRV